MILWHLCLLYWAFRDGSVGKESASHTGDTGNSALIPGQENPLEEKMATHFSILAWKISWTEEPGRLQSTWGCKESGWLFPLSLTQSSGQRHHSFLKSTNIF